MTVTIEKLIEQLQTIENKQQLFIGDVWIAEDFTYEDKEGEEVSFTPEELARVADYRSIGKSMGYFYDEILELLTEAKQRED
jgi:hypothetical protein